MPNEKRDHVPGMPANEMQLRFSLRHLFVLLTASAVAAALGPLAIGIWLAICAGASWVYAGIGDGIIALFALLVALLLTILLAGVAGIITLGAGGFLIFAGLGLSRRRPFLLGTALVVAAAMLLFAR